VRWPDEQHTYLYGGAGARLSISGQGAYSVNWDGSAPLTGISQGSVAETVIRGMDHERIVVTAAFAGEGTLAAAGNAWSLGSKIRHSYRGTTQTTVPSPFGMYTIDYQCTQSSLTMSDSDGVRATATRVSVTP
jgi:hypothetical protein